MNAPGSDALFATLDATWPPLHSTEIGPWCLRDGDGGGKRVSATTAERTLQDSDIDGANEQMRAQGRPPLYMIRNSDAALDAMLKARSFKVVDPTRIYVVPARDIAKTYPMTTTIPAWPPFALQREIWEDGGVDAARLRVMERVTGRKTSLLGRLGDTPGGTVFVAADGPIAMLHALEVKPSERRKGLGEILVRAAALWATEQGAEWLALAVTRTNEAANALYTRLGMSPVAEYHYRRAPEVTL